MPTPTPPPACWPLWAAIEEVLRTNPDNIVVGGRDLCRVCLCRVQLPAAAGKVRENLVITQYQDPQPGGRAAGLLHRPAGADHRHEPRQVQLQSHNVNSMTQAAGTAAIRDEAYSRGDRQAAGHPHCRHRCPRQRILPCLTHANFVCHHRPHAPRKFLRNCGAGHPHPPFSTRRAFPTTCASTSAPTPKCSASLRRWMRF